MRLDTLFRVSVYLTLALAALCLASADEAFLPGMMLFLIPVEILIGLACVLEGRWSLTRSWSNLIGLLIAVGSGVWIAWNITSPTNQWFHYAPYPVALLPYAAPLVLVLALAKLFRSASGPDFWMLHCVGLMQVALACTLAADFTFAFWLFAYLVCGLWSLGLHAQYRQAAQCSPHAPREGPQCSPYAPREGPQCSPHAPREEPHAEREDYTAGTHLGRRPWGRWGLRLAAWRALLVAGLGVAWFLVMPRYSAAPWSLLGTPSGGKLQTGYAPHIDLNYTGSIQPNDQPAFEVYAHDGQGHPYLSLNPAQRWRGNTLDLYVQGRWVHRHLDLPTTGGTTMQIPVAWPEKLLDVLPDLGPGQFYLDFYLDLRQSNGMFLADPVSFSPAEGRPPLCSDRWRWVPYFHGRDSTFLLPAGWVPHRYFYRQVVLPLADTAPRPAPALALPYRLRLLEQPIGRLNTWTREVLDRLVAAQRLAPADIGMAPDPELSGQVGLLAPNRAKVARALSEYLASSGEFTYKLEMRRHDFSVDAIEDFLCNVKQGYCEHFATGLVLMLRSVGIPARVVNGYRGAESEAGKPNRDGWYVVRHNQAHSWAEALVPCPGPDGSLEECWLMLDATPSAESPVAESASLTAWWSRGWQAGDDYWRDLILGYSRTRQEETATNLWDRLALDAPVEAMTNWWQSAAGERFRAAVFRAWWTVPAVLILGVGLWRWVVRRRRQPRSRLPVTAVSFYNHFLMLIARHCRLQPLPAQTAWEFGAVVSATLRARPATADLAAFPGEVVRHYYRIRFGGQALPPAEEHAVARRLHELEQALAKRPP